MEGAAKFAIPGNACELITSAVLAGFFGYYLFNIEVDNKCFSMEGDNFPVEEGREGDLDDIAYNYKVTFIIFFTVYMVEVTRALVAIVAAFVPFVAICNYCLGLGGCLGMAGFIIIHVFRLNHGGMVCAGDFYDDPENEANLDITLLERGKFLWGYLIFLWVLCGLGCCCCCVVIILMATGAAFR